MVDHLFDLVICALLIATIGHLALVQRRLRAFRAERDRLQAFVTALDLTVERAERALRRFAAHTKDAGAAPSTGPLPPRPQALGEPPATARGATGPTGGTRDDAAGDAASPAAAPTTPAKNARTLAAALQNAIGG